MFGWITSIMLRRSVRLMNEGDIGPTLSRYADDAVVIFPGDHSFGGEYRGKQRIGAFLQRLVDTGIQFEVQDIVVDGWPWRFTVCVRVTDSARDPDGNVVYSNRAVIFAKSRWGKIYYHEAYEDTQRVVEFDRYLERIEHATA
jgi:ketosteroid isomerase-like protein